MRVSSSTNVLAPLDQVWTFVSDPERVLSFMSGVTRWEVEGDQRTGLGARYRVLFRMGAAEIGGLIEVVEFEEPRELAWTSVQRSRSRFIERCRRDASPWPSTMVSASMAGASGSLKDGAGQARLR